ncbi:MAG: hypothetical protein SO170_01190 [Butyribacter sp.]|nr:hypothetical protein [bacterium]MDY3853565.1 hypothetical protein [Butyribacter sp.]
MQLIHKDRAEKFKEKVCPDCNQLLSELYPDELCPLCKERHLFNDVRDYIRENDVREHEVAEHFNIPISKVRGWIREGRIQYKGDTAKSITGVHCRICGKPISFGVTCAECHSLETLQVVAASKKAEAEEMRFLGKNRVE